MKRSIWLLVTLVGCLSCQPPGPAEAAESQASRAQEVARNLLMVDTHIDTPTRLVEDWEDVSGHASRGEFDFERARAGGLDGAFMSIYVPAKFGTGAAREHADKLIEIVESLVSDSPEKFALVRTPDDLVKARSEGKVGLAMGMENGSPVGEELAIARLVNYLSGGFIDCCTSKARSSRCPTCTVRLLDYFMYFDGLFVKLTNGKGPGYI